MNSVSIIIPTYNAPNYIIKCISSIKNKTKNVDYKIVVVDNCSNLQTKQILYNFLISSKIDALCFLEKNYFWSKANNVGANISPELCDKLLLLNSDVEVINDLWLKKLVDIHKAGLTSYGVVRENIGLGLPNRGDGYCALIDRSIYEKYYLDENFPWWYSITKIQSQILREGLYVQAIKNHDHLVKHYGGASRGDMELPINFTTVDSELSKSWFENNGEISIINYL